LEASGQGAVSSLTAPQVIQEGDMGLDDSTIGELNNCKKLIRQRAQAEASVGDDVLDRMEVMFDLNRFALRLARDFESIHRANGITWAGFRVLNMLWVMGDLEPSRLAVLTGSSRASISSAMNSLESSGMIKRTINKSNRRLVRVTLTAKGRNALSSAIPIQAERERAWLAVLSEGELNDLRSLMNRLLEQADPPRASTT
jgi:DNA-binding MarR family transcriptional regulator